MNLRWLVLKILDAIEFEGIFVHEAIERFTAESDLSKQDRAFIKKVVFGTIEQQIRIDYVINQFSKIKVNQMKPAVRLTLRLSVYQLLYMENIPDSAVCNEAVKLIKKRKMLRLTGFVNGVLRAIIRQKDSIQWPSKDDILTFFSVKYSFEPDIIQLLLEDYDKDVVENFLSVSNEQAPLTIRVQKTNITKQGLIDALEKEGVDVSEGRYIDDALHIGQIDKINLLDSFNQGYFQVQDESSMMVADVGFEDGMTTIIDLCAAPGGKTMHLADKLEGKGQVFAFDISDKKLDRVRENYTRLGLTNISEKINDATVLNQAYIGIADLIVADLPCSGLGIIRKKPDIKWHITVDRIKSLKKLQQDILEVAKNYVKPGGVLVFSTCTVTKTENQDNVDWFLDRNKDFELEPIQKNYSDPKTGMVSMMPISNGPDGFFIAKFRKKCENVKY
ncbi:16S rRNA (cytosine(967)-C(5))-methyltransferase [Petrocella atlantisensis]|uniref:16S rRNA (cytosine(967)-C(5))-methyltransferase n=1 Tax=Petrocella atlantisensis TaxID=2173034 RepID=A0A3P7RS70_9FIRM|nr:16S rRNA (cytosine(967)-C(5))-methyltransferase RsmB [Petrocella atlantisensis]VDN45866.1 16S rRNA (cytosine(967)-C(5))-methyltransferase [Petrocella atlantisensis]